VHLLVPTGDDPDHSRRDCAVDIEEPPADGPARMATQRWGGRGHPVFPTIETTIT
jgi:hypothetical protein